MVPAAVTVPLLAFQAAVAAAKPIVSLTPYQLAVLVGQGQAVLDVIDAALLVTNAALDAPDPTGHPTAMIADVLSRLGAATDASTLADMRGFVGRALLNLSQGVA